MRTRIIILVLVFCGLSLSIAQAEPSQQTISQIGVFTPAVDVVVKHTPTYFKFQGVTPQPDGILPAGTTVPVYGVYYDDDNHQVWCYTSPTLQYFVPCGQTTSYYIPAYGALAMEPGHDHPMTVTRPG